MGWFRALLANFDTFGGRDASLSIFSSLSNNCQLVLESPYWIASIRAIESPSKLDDQQWLTYWILYSFVSLVELSFWHIFYWIPFWGKLKFLGACWLVLPQFNGAAFVYDYFVKKKLFKQNSNGSNVSHRLERMMSPSAQTSVQQFIDNHGQDAFESVIAAATKEAQKYKLSPTKERQERY